MAQSYMAVYKGVPLPPFGDWQTVYIVACNKLINLFILFNSIALLEMHPKLSRNASENLAIETRIKETDRVLECVLPHHVLVPCPIANQSVTCKV